ncbi:[FeFe] hydrogenase H-cluster radical SAM maturase HydG [Gabonibacter chumensis]|uniref:[FeFe] hydrogenase H-cluster radical SAM maturase HydG n=1 Tax=Gabonibacter chumensis TaxID=2972474 RepID=UPI002573AB1B|nr:[FeFe] hydrogenase H-cluster radical SAM maturase HydG [Gabonibacter chumensis]MCR9011777.1 [FeFe] hydrogenase H-cluster radical SAM maturase HydG [Gabonibacter chumensis]
MDVKDWTKNVIKQAEIDKYLVNGKDFIDEVEIFEELERQKNPDRQKVRDIIKKSLEIKILTPAETATLLNVEDPELLLEMQEAALEVKRRVYDNRIVFFAPLYLSNLCVNSCVYCGFRAENKEEKRHVLTMDEVREETAAVIDEGHKRMIAVYGEHPKNSADYMADSISTIYATKRTTPTGNGFNNIRRVNVNAAPMEIADLKKLWRAGIGTYQVFQETYHRGRYAELHPAHTIKGNYGWRLYAMHRAMEAGIDDVAIGALFGLYDWRFEVMGLLYHALDLERQFGIGPHTVSFPRMQPAPGSFISEHSPYLVTDEATKRLVTVIRLAIPYTGLIVTARENPEFRRELIHMGCTQTDASSKIGIGAYSKKLRQEENSDKVQFMLGDQRSLDEVIRELAQDGMITSFCTAGYRCGRTGDKIMNLLEKGVEGKFCKLNAVLTFREYLNDYASPETKAVGEQLIERELQEIEHTSFFTDKKLLPTFKSYYDRIAKGERDLYM